MTDSFYATQENLLGHELIGLNVKISKSTDETRKGLQGKVIWETKNTLTTFLLKNIMACLF